MRQRNKQKSTPYHSALRRESSQRFFFACDGRAHRSADLAVLTVGVLISTHSQQVFSTGPSELFSIRART